jgi:hypothetical protein
MLNPVYWRIRKQMYMLAGDICPEGHPHFPPDDVCKQCDPQLAIKNAIDANAEKVKREIEERQARISKERG